MASASTKEKKINTAALKGAIAIVQRGIEQHNAGEDPDTNEQALALQTLEAAWEQNTGNSEICKYLAESYFRRLDQGPLHQFGVDRDRDAADLSLRVEDDSGLREYGLAYMSLVAVDKEQDNKAGIGWLEKSASKGYGRAYALLGHIYETASYGIKKNEEAALELYGKAVSHGYRAKPLRESVYRYYVESQRLADTGLGDLRTEFNPSAKEDVLKQIALHHMASEILVDIYTPRFKVEEAYDCNDI